MGDLLGPRPPRGVLRSCLGSVDVLKVESSPRFQKGLAWLLEESRNARLCLFCGEADPLTCHRHSLVGQNLLARGIKVGHTRRVPHPPLAPPLAGATDPARARPQGPAHPARRLGRGRRPGPVPPRTDVATSAAPCPRTPRGRCPG